MFRLSRNVIECLARELSPWIKDGLSFNGRQNKLAKLKKRITLHSCGNGVTLIHGRNGATLGYASGLKSSDAQKYLHLYKSEAQVDRIWNYRRFCWMYGKSMDQGLCLPQVSGQRAGPTGGEKSSD